ncbi:hypothetical protein H6504_00970 [Candidatus Woesearchaeota archaeon]|nr:hypothetical protein [Candidatus Woesearchaeota archaeon]
MGLFKKKESAPNIEDLKQRFSSLEGGASAQPQQAQGVQPPQAQPYASQQMPSQQASSPIPQASQQAPSAPPQVNVVEVEGDRETVSTIPSGGAVPDQSDDVLERVLLEKQEEAVESAKPISKSAINQYLSEIKESYDDARLINMVIQQVKELIEIDNNLNSRINDTEKMVKDEIADREKLQKTMEKHYLELKELEKNMDKFVALYELVTNKFNPFLDRSEEDLEMDQTADRHIMGSVQSAHGEAPVEQQHPATAQHGPAAAMFEKLKKEKEALHASAMQQAPPQAMQQQPQQTMQQAPPQAMQQPQQQVVHQYPPQQAAPSPVMVQPSLQGSVSQQPPGVPSAQTVPNGQPPVAQTKVLPEHLHFKLKSGQTINSLSQLLVFFKENSDESMQEYVTHYKNDFSAWIFHTFHNEWLSSKLSAAGSRTAMISALEEYIRSHQQQA